MDYITYPFSYNAVWISQNILWADPLGKLEEVMAYYITLLNKTLLGSTDYNQSTAAGDQIKIKTHKIHNTI